MYRELCDIKPLFVYSSYELNDVSSYHNPRDDQIL